MSEINSKRATLASRTAYLGPDHPLTLAARHALAEETFLSAIRRATQNAPALSPAIRDCAIEIIAEAVR
ncbi:hypothetical protein FIV07_09200 [Mycobacterium sp. THAF192]|nr:hypothetical protein FIV07_09200 [Mycobacterium sp. THAF192]